MTLQVLNLAKRYGGRPVVNDISFNIEPGEVVGLLGPNGAGKTTSFYAVLGIIHPDQGRILLNDQDISNAPIHFRARHGLGYLPQETSVFRRLTVEENIRLIQEFQPGTPDQKRIQLERLLKEFGLTKHRNQPAIQLSGGERRRTEIARAIVSNPKFLLLDEPFTGIDPIAIGDIHNLIIQLKSRGLGVLLTDHNPKATLSIVDRAYIIHDGQIIFAGTAQEVATNELVRQFYLGTDFQL